jgi:hypothetical protein
MLVKGPGREIQSNRSLPAIPNAIGDFKRKIDFIAGKK